MSATCSSNEERRRPRRSGQLSRLGGHALRQRSRAYEWSDRMVDMRRSGDHAAAEKPDRLRPRLLPQVSGQCRVGSVRAQRSAPGSSCRTASEPRRLAPRGGRRPFPRWRRPTFAQRAVEPARILLLAIRSACGIATARAGHEAADAKSAGGRSSTVVLPASINELPCRRHCPNRSAFYLGTRVG